MAVLGVHPSTRTFYPAVPVGVTVWEAGGSHEAPEPSAVSLTLGLRWVTAMGAPCGQGNRAPVPPSANGSNRCYTAGVSGWFN